VTIGPGGVEVPILLYHRIEPDPSSNFYRMDTGTFESQLKYLSAHGYHTITTAQLRQAILEGISLPPRPIIITFDDGNVDNFEFAYPLMQKYGFTGTAYIVANRLDSEGYLSKEQLQELAAAGWEIGSHSMTHLDLANATPQQLRREILESRLRLEDEIGVDVRSFAYPFGTFTKTLAQKIENYGYRTGVGLGKNAIHDLNSIYYLSRWEIHGTMTIDEFETLLGVSLTP
jgi:peptidoglycan/xylan/chitin deacetylase (PgdA/CDA1 family)